MVCYITKTLVRFLQSRVFTKNASLVFYEVKLAVLFSMVGYVSKSVVLEQETLPKYSGDSPKRPHYFECSEITWSHFSPLSKRKWGCKDLEQQTLAQIPVPRTNFLMEDLVDTTTQRHL